MPTAEAPAPSTAAAPPASNPTGFRITTGIYNLALGVWLGAMVMLAVAAPITFITMRQYGVTAQAAPYDQPALADQQIPIVAGGLVGQILKALTVVQVVCLVLAVACMVVQHAAFGDRLRGWRGNAARWALIGVAAAVLAVNLGYIGPRVYHDRAVMYAADTPPARRVRVRARFDRYHVWTTRTFSVATVCLLGAVIASPFAYRW